MINYQSKSEVIVEIIRKRGRCSPMGLRAVNSHLVLVFVEYTRRSTQQSQNIFDAGSEMQLLNASMAPRFQHLRWTFTILRNKLVTDKFFSKQNGKIDL